MREIIVHELTQATQELVREFARFLPRLMVMLIVVLVGWVIAYLVKAVLRSFLRLIKFDKLSEGAGATQLLNKAALPSSTELVSRFAFWTAWLGFILVGVSALGILGMQEYVTRFFVFLPRLLVSLIFLFIGLLAASFFSRAALLWAVNTDMPSPRLLSSAARVLITVFTASAVSRNSVWRIPPCSWLLPSSWERSCWAWPLLLASAARSWPEDFWKPASPRKKRKEKNGRTSFPRSNMPGRACDIPLG